MSIFNDDDDRFLGGRPRFLLVLGVSDEVDTTTGSSIIEEGVAVVVALVAVYLVAVDNDDDDFVTTDVLLLASMVATAVGVVIVVVVVDDFPPLVNDLDDGGSYDFLLLVDGGLPGPRFNGCILLSSRETDDHDDLFFIGFGCGGGTTGDGSEACSLSLFFPFFFLVVNVMGLSSVYIVVGVLCLLGRLIVK